jgi:hypothetical protein
MRTSLEGIPTEAEGDVDFIPEKDINDESWQAFDRELEGARGKKNGLELATVAADKALMGRPEMLSDADRGLIRQELERTRGKLSSGNGRSTANPLEIEEFTALAADAELAGEKVELTGDEVEVLVEDFQQYKGKEGYEEAAARKAAQLNMLGINKNSPKVGEKVSLGDEDIYLLQARLDKMYEQGYEPDQIVEYAANIRLAGMKPEVSENVIEAARSKMYEAQDEGNVEEVRKLGSRLAILAAKDMRREGGPLKVKF